MSKKYKINLMDGSCLDFQELFHQYFQTLVTFANRYIEEEESKSLVQDVFLILWENRSDFPDALSVKAYLYSSVKNKALNVLKHRKVERGYVEEMEQNDMAEIYYMQSVIEEETRRLIVEAIEALPIPCKTVCLLNLEGKSNQEIADELRISLNTVKYHKKNAYKLLREKLKGQFYLLFLI